MDMCELAVVMFIYLCSLGCTSTYGHQWEKQVHNNRMGLSGEGGGINRAKRTHGISGRPGSPAGDHRSGKNHWSVSIAGRQVEHGAGIQHYSRYEQETGTHWRRTHNKRATSDLNSRESAPKTMDFSAPLAGDSNGQTMSRLHEIAKVDHIASVLETIEHIRLRSQAGNCSGVHILDLKKNLSNSSLKRFGASVQNAIRVSNVLNNMFRSWDLASSGSNSLYNDAFYYSLVRAMVEGDQNITGAAIAFDMNKYENDQRLFSPYAFRDLTTNTLHIMNIADQTKPRGQYTVENTRGYGWFWKHRLVDYSSQLYKIKDCRTTTDPDSAEKVTDMSRPTVVTTTREGLWSSPYFDCDGAKTWIMSYSVPFFGCGSSRNPSSELGFKGVVKIDVDLGKVDIDQCKDDDSAFANTHRCKDTTQCAHIPGLGFRSGAYKCECMDSYYFDDPSSAGNNHNYFNGSLVEKQYLFKLLNQTNSYDRDFQCLPCPTGCMKCKNDSPCRAEIDVMMRGIPLGVESFCMTITLVLGFVIIRLRKTKVMKASMWPLLEILLFGALLLYSTVVIQYFEPTNVTCLLIPWFREVGFSIVYGALILKVYRVLAEFQSRKAHRVHVRDKDLLKYLCCIVVVVIGYVACWTAINLDHVRDGKSLLVTGKVPKPDGDHMEYYICKTHWWDYVIEAGEFLFLCFGIYLCYCTRSAPSDYYETRYVSWAIYNETLLSALLHIIRHFLWQVIHPDFIFLMYFIRCQLTVSITLILVLGPKLWYAHRPPEDDNFRHRAYSTSDVHESILPESMKLHVGVNSNGDVDVGEINLSEMDPEDIRAELKRLYTKLQIYKTKTMRKDNPHISKRRGGRKQTHRRFSLQAFHHKHRHHHSEHSEHDHEMSKTPEESTNSAEGVAISMEESSVGGCEPCRTPTVTFKPGHKSIY